MTPPTIIDIPHTLGREEAERRLRARIGELAGHIPGGMADVKSSWPGEHRMAIDVTAMGQLVSALLDVEESRVRVQLSLPPMLSFMAGLIGASVKDQGTKMLRDDRKA